MKSALRWIAVLPTAALASWLAWLAISGWYQHFLASQNFFFRATVEFIAGVARGGAFVYVGAWVAPNHKRATAYALAAIALLLHGALFYYVMKAGNYWAMWSCVSAAFGVSGYAYQIYRDTSEFRTSLDL